MFKDLQKKYKISENSFSMLLGAAIILVAALVVFNFFKQRQGQISQPATIEEETTLDLVKEKGQLPTEHTVVVNENLWAIAEFYYQSGYNWTDIASANNLASPDNIEVGQKLTIPDAAPRLKTIAAVQPTQDKTPETNQKIEGSQYTVVPGDNLWNIALRAYGDGFRWVELAKTNNLAHPDLIHKGNNLTLPR